MLYLFYLKHEFHANGTIMARVSSQVVWFAVGSKNLARNEPATQKSDWSSSYVASLLKYHVQSGRSPKVVALFSATNFNSYIIELLQLQDAIQIQWNYAWIHNNIAKRSHLMI